jgi:splicing factor U2AF subunit
LAENSARHQQQHHHHHPQRMSGHDYGQGSIAPISSAARQARRLYVGQIPYAIDEQSTSNFFNDAMRQMKGTDEVFVASVQINRDKNYAFVEVSEYATHVDERST